MISSDDTYALKSEDERQRRLEMLSLPHLRPLVEYLKRVKSDCGHDIPYFDPCDGGVNATVLFLLEAPGRRAVGSTFISRNNPDQTASNMNELLMKAGIPRAITLLWNIVPWYIGDGKRIREARKSDIGQAMPYFLELIHLLPKLREIVLVGKNAQSARAAIQKHTSVPLVDAPHPSPKNFNSRPHKKTEAIQIFSELATRL